MRQFASICLIFYSHGLFFCNFFHSLGTHKNYNFFFLKNFSPARQLTNRLRWLILIEWVNEWMFTRSENEKHREKCERRELKCSQIHAQHLHNLRLLHLFFCSLSRSVFLHFSSSQQYETFVIWTKVRGEVTKKLINNGTLFFIRKIHL